MPTLSTENVKKRPSISEELWEAHHLVDSGQFHEALSAVKHVKALEPRNIYVLAFEKQLEQLIEYGEANILSDEQRADILESIPGIIERAIDGAAVAQLSSERAQSAVSAPASRDDKAAALEWLKDQYFQRAHDYVQQGQYNHALAEIRRVYIIDPNNKTAREFEQRIELLANLKPGPQPPTPPPLRLVTKESIANDKAAEPPIAPPDEQEVVPVKSEEWSSPAVEVKEDPAHEAHPVKKRTLRQAVTFVLLLAIIAAGTTIYLLWRQSQIAKRSQQRPTTVINSAQPETFIGAPTTAEEQSYVVSSAPEESESSTPLVSEETTTAKEAPKQTANLTSRTNAKPSKTVEKPKTAIAKTRSDEKRAAAVPQTSAGQSARPVETPASTPANTEASPAPTAVLEKEAQIIKLERPRFSDAAYGAGLSGQIVVQVQIDAQGTPLQTKVLNVTNQLLVEPVINAVMKSRFSPAHMSSGPVISWMTIPFRFAS